MRRFLKHDLSTVARLSVSLPPVHALAVETTVIMVRPKNCLNSDEKEAELRTAGIPYTAFNPIDHLEQSVAVMTRLFDTGVTAGPNPVMVVNGVPLRTNLLKELRSLLRYRN
jgi:hypothetical protein